MNPMVVEALGSIFRAGLQIAAGYLVVAGIWSPEDSSKYVAAGALALITLGWSLWQKYGMRVKLLTAMASPKLMTEAEVEVDVAAAVVAPSVMTPKHEMPLL